VTWLRWSCSTARLPGAHDSGQGNVYVEAARHDRRAGNDIWVPGAITVDSDGTTTCTASPRYASPRSGNNVNNYIIAENDAGGLPGVILSYAQLVNPSRFGRPIEVRPERITRPVTPVQPCPVGGNRVTRAPIDHRYNCKATYPSSLDIAGCPTPQATRTATTSTNSSPLTGVRARTPTSRDDRSILAGHVQRLPAPGEPTDTCQINSAVSIDLGSGNWFINCPNTGGSGNTPGFRLSNNGARFSAGPGDIVFAGGVR
jgi:hypothetical protein